MTAVGTRVIAIRDSDRDAKRVNIYGYGTYAGDFPRPGSGQRSAADIELAISTIVEMDGRGDEFDRSMVDWAVNEGRMTVAEGEAKLAEVAAKRAADQARPIAERAEALLARMDLNPRIDLDNGTSVWGFMCWWGPAETVETRFADYELVTVEFSDRELEILGLPVANPTGTNSAGEDAPA